MKKGLFILLFIQVYDRFLNLLLVFFDCLLLHQKLLVLRVGIIEHGVDFEIDSLLLLLDLGFELLDALPLCVDVHLLEVEHVTGLPEELSFLLNPLMLL